MCGITGYIGKQTAHNILLSGLQKLEYRGYDSAGIAVIHNNSTALFREEGKLLNLINKVHKLNPEGCIGIGHTRWATHGAPTTINAHPHKAGIFTIVHNGIIENYKEIKNFLISKNVEFQSQTDSEIIAQLINYNFALIKDFKKAVSETIKKLEGAFAVLVLCELENYFIAFKQYSPLVLGVGKGENFVASDVPAILNYTNQFIYLEDGELAVIEENDIKLFDFDLNEKKYSIKTLNISPLMAEKGNYKHFMLKEINEQNRSIADTFRGRILEGGDNLDLDLDSIEDFLKNDMNHIIISACGTSWHSGLIGKYFIEQIAKVRVEVDYASEYRYRKPIIDKNTLIIAISQSGETADTLASIRIGKEECAKILSICNVFNSSIPRYSDAVLYTYAGPEIGVASTKAFTTQLSLLALFAVYLKKVKSGVLDSELLKELLMISEKVNKTLKNSQKIFDLANKYQNYEDFLFLGRGLNFPIALEGALKLKEISYIHAEGYPAGEMKHGPIALIDEKMPTFIIATDGNHYEKVLSNLQEIRARKGKVIAIATEGNEQIKEFCDDVVYIPKTLSYLEPFLTVIPLQLFAYFVADLKGTDVDQPRNLAKSVTVE